MSGVATLSNEKNYTVFQFENHVIRFIAPYSLERYIAVKLLPCGIRGKIVGAIYAK